MNIHRDAPKSQVSGINFLELLVHALLINVLINVMVANSEPAKHVCKSHTVSAENYLYLLLSNTWFGYYC